MKYTRQFTIAGALAVAGIILASCTAVVEDNRPMPPRPDRGPMCTREYAPVCGERGRDTRMFSNSCQARAAGYRITDRRECSGDRADRGDRHDRDRGDRRDRNDRHDRSDRNDRHDRNDRDRDRGDRGQRACTMEYAPVCARGARGQRTFPNACQARAASYNLVHGGAC